MAVEPSGAGCGCREAIEVIVGVVEGREEEKCVWRCPEREC